MVRIRMQRFGRRHRPFFRINAIDQRTRRNGQVIEPLGHYDPLHPDESKQLVLKEEAIKKWLDKGAQPSKTVTDMLAPRGLLSPAMLADWEKQREFERNLSSCKAAMKRVEAAAAAVEEGGLEGDAANAVKKALNEVKRTLPLAKHEEAEKQAGIAESSLDAAKKAAASAKPAEEETPAEASEE